MGSREHWEKLYSSKPLEELGWYQKTPFISWQLMEELGITPSSRIIDVGGGDSLFVDYLLDRGFQNITVLDISEAAIERARRRLGGQADKVSWVVADITAFSAAEKFDFWHDRAVMHFLLEKEAVDKYLEVCRTALADNGKLVIGTFSDKGPEKCSGLPVRRYSEAEMSGLFSAGFKKIRCLTDTHITPSGKEQNYIYCGFSR